MIQRIQSIYLLLAAILMAVTAFSPILLLEGDLTLYSYGVEGTEGVVKPTWGVVSMAGISALLSLIAVFLFKNRKQQGKIASLTILFIVFYFVTAVVYMASFLDNFPSGIVSVTYGIAFPILALIMLLLAKKAINKDEKLVRSLDRIR